MRYIFRCATSFVALHLSLRYLFRAPPPVRPRVFKSVTFDVTFDVTLANNHNNLLMMLMLMMIYYYYYYNWGVRPPKIIHY